MKGASGGMEQVLKRIENLLTVKSIVTLALTAVFAWQAVKGDGISSSSSLACTYACFSGAE